MIATIPSWMFLQQIEEVSNLDREMMLVLASEIEESCVRVLTYNVNSYYKLFNLYYISNIKADIMTPHWNGMS